MSDELLTVEMAIPFIGMSRQLIYKYIKNGELTAFKVGKGWKLKKKHIEDFLIKRQNRTLQMVRCEESNSCQNQQHKYLKDQIVNTGGSHTRRQTVSEYENLLGLRR